jgi:lycopene cyclase domain-containing protein
MSYFGFLLRFLVIPLVLIGGVTWHDLRRGITRPLALRNWPAWVVLLVHVVVALLYTTPWDNYLVATGVWWYDPTLVTGITLGWVPLEEYTFFVLQTLTTGLWLLYLARRLPVEDSSSSHRRQTRWIAAFVLGLIWLTAVAMLLVGWQPGTYLALELTWALPPIVLQLAFGADILWHHRRLVLLSLLPSTFYLCIADVLAIGAGTWTINPARSLNVYLGGGLPLEEIVFFTLTNTLVVFGMVLGLARESRDRIPARIRSLGSRRPEKSGMRRLLSPPLTQPRPVRERVSGLSARDENLLL